MGILDTLLDKDYQAALKVKKEMFDDKEPQSLHWELLTKNLCPKCSEQLKRYKNRFICMRRECDFKISRDKKEIIMRDKRGY